MIAAPIVVRKGAGCDKFHGISSGMSPPSRMRSAWFSLTFNGMVVSTEQRAAAASAATILMFAFRLCGTRPPPIFLLLLAVKPSLTMTMVGARRKLALEIPAVIRVCIVALGEGGGQGAASLWPPAAMAIDFRILSGEGGGGVPAAIGSSAVVAVVVVVVAVVGRVVILLLLYLLLVLIATMMMMMMGIVVVMVVVVVVVVVMMMSPLAMTLLLVSPPPPFVHRADCGGGRLTHGDEE